MCFLREQLGVVMLFTRFQLLPPLKERPESGVWLFADDTLISVSPNLQANERNTDVQGLVELKEVQKKNQIMCSSTHSTTLNITHRFVQSSPIIPSVHEIIFLLHLF